MTVVISLLSVRQFAAPLPPSHYRSKIHRPFFSPTCRSAIASPLPLCSTELFHLTGRRNPRTFTVDQSSPYASSSRRCRRLLQASPESSPSSSPHPHHPLPPHHGCPRRCLPSLTLLPSSPIITDIVPTHGPPSRRRHLHCRGRPSHPRFEMPIIATDQALHLHWIRTPSSSHHHHTSPWLKPPADRPSSQPVASSTSPAIPHTGTRCHHRCLLPSIIHRPEPLPETPSSSASHDTSSRLYLP